MNSKTKQCQNCKGNFIIEPEDFVFYEKIGVPAPTFCPECRMQRRLSFRNQNNLFKVKDAFTGKEIFSLVPPDSGIKVITQEEWFSDSWNAMDYGVDVDFSKSFLSQIFELHKEIPQYNLNVTNVVDSPYSGNATDLKNCYLVFGANNNQDCMYGTGYYDSSYCLDNCDVYQSELCYGSIWLQNCFRVNFSEQCRECSDVWFSKNCSGCLNCVNCVNLRNKSYQIENKQYTKEEYLKKIKELNLNSYDGFLKMKEASGIFWKKFPNKYIQGIKNIDSTGVYITNSKNVKNSYLVENGENLKYCQFISVAPNKDSYDISIWGSNSESCYEYSTCGNGAFGLKFVVNCWPNVRDLEYCLNCRNSSDLFGCVGLQNKQYCILNKQYTKEEYFELVEKIKKHMLDTPYMDKKGRVYKYGEFFPIEFSWYGYNNTLAQEYLPITKEDALANNYKWYDVLPGNYKTTLLAKDIKNDITEIDEKICKEVIECLTCNRKFKIMPDEFIFLKKEGILIPRNCPNCRYEERISRRLKHKLYKMKCMKDGCNNEFETGYNPKDGDIVYCEKCYQQEVY
jgi:hypothetical protein